MPSSLKLRSVELFRPPRRTHAAKGRSVLTTTSTCEAGSRFCARDPHTPLCLVSIERIPSSIHPTLGPDRPTRFLLFTGLLPTHYYHHHRPWRPSKQNKTKKTKRNRLGSAGLPFLRPLRASNSVTPGGFGRLWAPFPSRRPTATFLCWSPSVAYMSLNNLPVRLAAAPAATATSCRPSPPPSLFPKSQEKVIASPDANGLPLVGDAAAGQQESDGGAVFGSLSPESLPLGPGAAGTSANHQFWLKDAKIAEDLFTVRLSSSCPSSICRN